MSRLLSHGLAALALIVLVSLQNHVSAIEHGCTDDDIGDIVIDIDFDGQKSKAVGPFCSAIHRAEAVIARSSLSPERRKAAYATLAQLQNVIAKEGRSLASKRIAGPEGCRGTAGSASGGLRATVSCAH
jgi:hypothetical protein